ncbi:CLOCK-interacting pacemaker-like [Polypterus senegalus]|nr:CLOCK-interacting pacemaker-like [Polypterus senegalus]XP_039624083.1 CLOCK-interacting pacemaker-like [Polypterus senegalus]XP_039624084.1 CLOCK-interacting pacemaker-like [Polypterus senegalus]
MAPDDNIPRNSSKTAKEQSNCATMKAEHAVMDLKRSDGTISRCESEKDSGYSDTSSEYLQTDSEDQSRSSSRCSFGNISARQKGVAFESLTPVYIVKNVVLKQPLTVQTNPGQILQSELSWGGQQTQVLFIQQPEATANMPLKPQQSPKKLGKAMYLPILNSYPKIAPHPSKTTEPSKTFNGKVGDGVIGHTQSKRVCVEARRDAISSKKAENVSFTTLKKNESQEQKHQTSSVRFPSKRNSVTPSLQQQVVATSDVPDHCIISPCTNESSVIRPPMVSGLEPSVSSTSVISSLPGMSGQDESGGKEIKTFPKVSKKHASNIMKQRRFLNTVEILSRSGLLGITLRTKDLIRQNHSTQMEISELKEHTRLLCEAIHTNDLDAWAKLQEVMALSGQYKHMNECQTVTTSLVPEAVPSVGQTLSNYQPVNGCGHAASSLPQPEAVALDLSSKRHSRSSKNVQPDSSTSTPRL